jgi:hypothetical protein
MLVPVILGTLLIKWFRQWKVVKIAPYDISLRPEMKLGLQNFAIIMAITEELY